MRKVQSLAEFGDFGAQTAFIPQFRFGQWYRTNHRDWAELQRPGLAWGSERSGGLTGRREDAPVVFPMWRACYTQLNSKERNNYDIITGRLAVSLGRMHHAGFFFKTPFC